MDLGPGDPISGSKRSSNKIRFSISGTSLLTKDLITWFAKWYLVFSLTEAGEQQIGWVPEKDQATMDAVGKVCDLPNFHAKIDSTNTKNIGDNFTEVTIFIIIIKR